RQQVDFQQPQTWISVTPRAEKHPTSFNELTNTPIEFSAFVMNWLNITNLTQEFLVGPAFNLLKRTCKSLTELEYHYEECSKATTERLDWHNPKGKLYPFDLRKPFLLIPDHRGHQFIPQDYFINNDLEYLKGGSLSRQYSTSVTKIKVATYEFKWIEDLVPNLWSSVKVTALYDITSGIRMEYQPKRKWSGLDKRRASVMIKDIDKQISCVGIKRLHDDLRVTAAQEITCSCFYGFIDKDLINLVIPDVRRDITSQLQGKLWLYDEVCT
nr:hypothetical protein [Tanacetum cinerariifolium]